MTRKKRLLILLGFFMATVACAQKPLKDSTGIDSTFTDYDHLFNELDALLDSLIAPRSFVVFNVGIGNNYFSYSSKSSYLLAPSRKFTYVPSLAYFDKSGFGISATGAVVNDGQNINPFQLYFTASYDYLKNNRFVTGIAYSHFFTKDSLPFYTSPLNNEFYAYFTWRKTWIKPGLGLSYGWGSRTEYNQRADYITSMQLIEDGYTTVNSQETINDFSISASLRHDFYWLNVLSKNDYIRLTPMLVYTEGTQQFGFNQSNNSYTTLPKTDLNTMSNSNQVFLDNQLNFQPLSLSAFIKAEYTIGKFFVQPQVMFGYYFPAKENNFSTVFLVNAGFIF